MIGRPIEPPKILAHSNLKVVTVKVEEIKRNAGRHPYTLSWVKTGSKEQNRKFAPRGENNKHHNVRIMPLAHE